MAIAETSGPVEVVDISGPVRAKLVVLQEKLGADDINSALDKSLNIAYFIANTLNDPENKLLIERKGKYQELKGIA